MHEGIRREASRLKIGLERAQKKHRKNIDVWRIKKEAIKRVYGIFLSDSLR